MARASTKRTKPTPAAVPASPPPTATSRSTPLSKAAQKKISLYTTQRSAPGGGTPFPQWPHPTADEAQEVCDLLASVHGMPQRPGVLVDRPDAAAGCGAVPDVLDALIRTTLSQNTTSKNSTAAKRQMDEVYGRAAYRAVLEGGEAKLEETIRCGGLAKNKAKAILGVLRRCEERNIEKGGKAGEGELSLDWLHELSDGDAMKQLISFDSIGIKTASCVLLFCLGRDSFAVDTHVHRITNWLGWTPQNGSVYSSSSSSAADKASDAKSTFTRLTSTTNPPTRDQTFYHLDAVLPSHLKYPLHSLLVRHGRGCVKCSANGVTSQDFVDTCPIAHLVSKSGGKKKPKGTAKKGAEAEDEVPVKDEEGHVIGTASVSTTKPTFHPLADAPIKAEEELGSKAHEAVKLEDEVGGGATSSPRRSSRPKRKAADAKRVKEEDGSESDLTDLDEDEQQEAEEEDYKPAKRARRTLSPSKQKQGKSTTKKAGGRSTKPAVSPNGGKKGKGGKDGSSVDRDEAEMSGRAWIKGEMHGLEA
ncbi:hypothetical protein JCM11251_007599 [Rhodosporidiobolus azoricus]